jgi:general secretion pathway protein H
MNAAQDSRRHDHAAEAGFTMLEVLVALTIFLMVIATVGTTIARRDMTPTPLQTAKTMQSMLFRARSDAILRGADTAFVIDMKAKRFAYPKGSAPIALPEGGDIRMLTGGELISESGEVLLLFRADGSSSGAEILLSDGRSAEARINVNWLTGVPLLLEGEAQ